eukprot:2431032-Pyramimonas_sp.AAC.1
MHEDGGPRDIPEEPDVEIVGQCDVGDITMALSRPPNVKSATVLKWTDPLIPNGPRQDPEGAVAELWKLGGDLVGGPLLGVFQAAQAFRR